MAKFERHEPVVMDHSAIIQAKGCLRRYFYRIVLARTEKDSPQYFGFGSCYHKFREVLEREFANAPKSERMLPDTQMIFFQRAVAEARRIWKQKRMVDPPVGSKWEFLTEARLIESCAVAFKHWQREKEKGVIEVLAIEQNFIVPLPDGSVTGGKADQIIRWHSKVWGRDFKTSSKTQNTYYSRTLDPNDQFTRYTYAEAQLSGQPVQGQLVEVLFNGKSTKKEKKGPSIHPYLATRSTYQIEQWVKESMFFNELLERCREADVWPMQETNCSFCPYHSVCKQASERGMMAKLEAEFRVEPWDCTNRDVDD